MYIYKTKTTPFFLKQNIEGLIQSYFVVIFLISFPFPKDIFMKLSKSLRVGYGNSNLIEF